MPSQPVMVLISSEASWNNWQQLCGQNNIDVKWIYLALGERLAQLLKNARFTNTSKRLTLFNLIIYLYRSYSTYRCLAKTYIEKIVYLIFITKFIMVS